MEPNNDASPASPSTPARPDPDHHPHRWWTGAVPLTILALATTAIVVAVVPGARHQLALSASREPQSYVELYFEDSTQARSCPTQDGRLFLSFVVNRHDVGSPLEYRVTTTPGASGTGTPTRAAQGTVGAEGTDGPVVVDENVATPRSAHFTVQVDLVGRSEHLVLHCPAAST